MADQKLVFLCPAGHQLHGPLSLAGRAGQCPHCGARFRIPTLEEMAAAAEGPAEPAQVAPAEPENEFIPPPAEEFTGELLEDVEILDDELTDGIGHEGAASKLPIEGRHPTAVAFEELWPLHGPSVTVEIYLKQNQTLVPVRYARELSQGAVGVFAARDEQGRFTLQVVPWDEVCRVEIRGVTELPDRWFT